MLNHHSNKILLLLSAFLLFSCNKLVEIPDPKNSLTTDKVFNNDTQAIGAMAGILTQMINAGASSSFANGLVNQIAMASADELSIVGSVFAVNNSRGEVARNALTAESTSTNNIWSSAYQAIYGANGVIEGIEASKSVLLHAQTRTQLTAEAKFIRAFSYFYLVNCFGDVPLVLTTNLAENSNKPRTAVNIVYQQIIKDLIEAINGLPADYAAGGENASGQINGRLKHY
ncbi:RagB/SusD family nutrient uptake outer membrane protein [Pedobacter sp. P26]|uniref:RagB/SusD family nutrient uptake outer membrane protein n=1 Tax=Pedobacter sp. P26 TaxID=3423956 RepID=UPI003D678933